MPRGDCKRVAHRRVLAAVQSRHEVVLEAGHDVLDLVDDEVALEDLELTDIATGVDDLER